MDEKEHKKRRRSMRTLRRTSGVLPINLLTLDPATENENIEGKPVEEEGSTLGSIWFDSDSPKKERRKRRSNIFSLLPIQAINENEDEAQNIPAVDEVLTNDAKPVDNIKNNDNLENENLNNEPAILEKIAENDIVPTTDTEILRHGNSNENDPMSHTSANSESIKVNSNSADNLANVEVELSDNVPPYTPSCSDKDGRFDISVNSGTGITPPDLDVSKHSHSSMSPEYPMISPVPAEYTNTMSHHESYIERGESSIVISPAPSRDQSDLSLSDKENSVLANINNSDVKECSSPQGQAEIDLSENVSPGFLSVCKTFAGKVVNFVKTSPSYLTSTLLNKTDTTDVSASPALKMNNDVVAYCVKTVDDKSVLTDKNQPLNKDIDSESECPVGSSITWNKPVVLPDNKLSEDTNNVPVTPLSLTESARKKRDRERQLILDTFNAIYTEEINKDSERDQSVKKCKQALTDAGEPSISTKDETVLRKCSDSVDNDEINELEHDSYCIASESARVNDNSKQTDDVLESSRGKIVDEKTSLIQGETDFLVTPDLTETGMNACRSSNKSSERKRKRRALDVAFVDKNAFETNEKSDNNLIENRSEDLVSEDTTVAFNADKNHPVSEKEPDSSSKRSEPPVPRLSLNKVLSNETSSSKCSIDADSSSSLENGSFKKNGRRRAFGFIGKLKDKHKSATGNSKTDVKPECGDSLGSNALDIEVDIVKSKLPRSGENKMSEIVRVKDNQMKSDTNNTASIVLTSAERTGSTSESETSYDVTQSKLEISVDKINELKKKVQKPKNTRKRISGNFNYVSKNKPKYQLCVTGSGDNEEVGKNVDGVDTRNLRSELPGGASSAEHVLSIQNECDMENLDLNDREGQAKGIEIPVKDDTSSKNRNKATNEIKLKNMKSKPDYSQFVKSLTKTPVANKTEKLGAKTPVANKTEKFGAKTPVANKTEKLGTRTPVISKTEKLEAKTHVANKTEKLVAKTPVANKTEKFGAKTTVGKIEKFGAKTPVANKIEKFGTKTPIGSKTGDKNETEKGNKESKKPVGKKCIDFVKLNIDKHKQATREKDSSEKHVVPIAKTYQKSEVTIQNNDNSASIEKRAIVTNNAKKEQKKSGRRKSGNLSAVLNVENSVKDADEISVTKHQNQVDSITIPDIGLDNNEVNSNKCELQIPAMDVSASLSNDKKVTDELEKSESEFASNLELIVHSAEESKTKLNDKKIELQKSGRRKSADVASLNVYKNQIKELEMTECQDIADTASCTNNEQKEVNVTESEMELSVDNVEPKKRGRPKLTNAASSSTKNDENNDLVIPQHSNIAETDSATDIEQKVENVVENRVELKEGVNPPKKRGRRKSADAASLSIKKNFAVEHDSSINQSITELDSVSEQNMDNVIDVFTELKEGMSQPKKRGRPKSVDTASLSKNPEISENSNIAETSSSGEQNMSDGKTAVKKRGRRKSADAATLNLKLCVEDSVDIELDAETASNVQATGKRQRRKSADSASLKLQLLSETDIYDESALCSSDMKKGKKRKFETLEEIELLYRNKNYVKPEEKKPWQTIVESPTAPSEIFKKQRLYRFIDHEHPSQMKLRRRAQKALKNGWNPKKRKHVELSDDFVKQKLASLWSELDDQSDDLANKLKSIIDTE